jgi:hypothetical protein
MHSSSELWEIENSKFKLSFPDHHEDAIVKVGGWNKFIRMPVAGFIEF